MAKAKRLTMIDRVQAGIRIAAARNKPKPDSWAAVAKSEGLSERACQRIFTDYTRAAERHQDPTGLPVLEETLLAYEEVIRWFASAAEDADQWSSRVAAARSMVDALKDRLELLIVMGRMPRSIQAAGDRQRVQAMVRRMAEVLERHDVDPEVIRDLLEVLEEDRPREIAAA